VPAGYGFDYINADGLIHELSAAGGRIKTSGGMSYRVLGLDPYSRHMSLPVLRAIHKLVEDGAVVAGPKPNDDPSLADDQAEFRKAERRTVWRWHGRAQGWQGHGVRGPDADRCFAALHVAPDFDYSKPESDTRLLFVHRKLADGDLYFVDNRSDRSERGCNLPRNRQSARVVARRDRQVGARVLQDRRRPHDCAIAAGTLGHGVCGLPQGGHGTSRTLPAGGDGTCNRDGPWKVSFQPDRGAPPSITLDKLSSWSENPMRE
jgi:hypothetical protein